LEKGIMHVPEINQYMYFEMKDIPQKKVPTYVS